jgi:tRNA-2-methylthio-N6-dimethylallyladenosine synthase
LLGQNVNSYGQDRPGEELSFAQLLREVGEIGQRSRREFWVYFTSPHPRDMTEEVLRIIAAYPCLAKQIHLPLQSGDDKILLRMNRTYEVDQYRATVHAIRKILPTTTLFTDIIVGFSGETEEQFGNTLSAMREFAYNMAYVAQYSPRPGAASFRWSDDVPHEEKSRRLHALNEELAAGALRRNQALIGTTCRVLVEGPDRREGYLAGRTEGRIPLRFAATDASLIGSFVEVRIVSVAPLSLQGELLPAPVAAADAGS